MTDQNLGIKWKKQYSDILFESLNDQDVSLYNNITKYIQNELEGQSNCPPILIMDNNDFNKSCLNFLKEKEYNFDLLKECMLVRDNIKVQINITDNTLFSFKVKARLYFL